MRFAITTLLFKLVCVCLPSTFKGILCIALPVTIIGKHFGRQYDVSFFDLVEEECVTL